MTMCSIQAAGLCVWVASFGSGLSRTCWRSEAWGLLAATGQGAVVPGRLRMLLRLAAVIAAACRQAECGSCIAHVC